MVKRFRAALVLCAAFVLTFSLCGCAASQEKYVPQLKDAVVTSPVIGENGVLRVGVNTGNVPLAGKGEEAIIGIDVDIAAAMADELGLKLSIVDVGSDPASALAEGTVDIVMGVDEADADGAFWLTSTYIPTGVAVFSLSPDAGVPVSGDGSTFAAQVSSKSAWAAGNEFGLEALQSTATLTDAFKSLESGEVDYAVADAIIGLYGAHSEGIDVHVSAMLLAPSGYCVGVSSANTDLQNAISQAVSTLSANGVIGVIEMKWLGTTVDLSEVPMTAGVNFIEETLSASE